MSDFWSPDVHVLAPYVPGEQPKTQKLIKLNTNESPYPPSPKVLEAISEAASALRLYPDPQSSALKQSLATYHKLQPEHVFVGNGSDEVLAHAFAAFFRQRESVLTPDISYSFYPVYAKLYAVDLQYRPLDAGFNILPSDYQGESGGVILANPNAPTGLLLSVQDIEQILKAQPNSVVLVDEAYIDYGGDSADGLIEQYPNLLVVRTFSKSRALAGLRVGYALGHPALIEGLNRVKDSFNSYPVDRLAEAGAIASIEDENYFNDCVEKTKQSRAWLSDALSGLDFEVLPSSANFVFTRPAERSAAQWAERLRAKNICVRHFSTPRIDDFLRISIGLQSDCEALLQAIEAG